MDKLVTTLATTCQRAEHVEATRIMDPRHPRLPLQQKSGAGLIPAEFDARVAAGNIKHHGRPASVAMITDVLRFQLDAIQESIGPVVTSSTVRTDFLAVQAGEVAGVQQIDSRIAGDQQKIRPHLQMSVGSEKPRAEITPSGFLRLECQSPGGVRGDLATVAVVVNCVRLVAEMHPVLGTGLDIPIRYFGGWSPLGIFQGKQKREEQL